MPERDLSITIQKRDVEILRGLFESRTMSSLHIAALHFEGSYEAAKKRLQKLKAAGLIGERARRASEYSVLFLTRKALNLLKAHGILAEYPKLNLTSLEKRGMVSELTLRHEFEIMDVKASFFSSLRKTGNFTLAEFSTWPLLYQFEAFRSGYNGAEVLVKPDGFIRIHEVEPDGSKSEHTFFLEVDRSTESQDFLIARIGAYLDYFKSGGFAVRNGGTRDRFRDFPFRVLVVCKNAERRNNCAERLFQQTPPILSLACLSTFEEVKRDPFGPIWIQPRDYREVVKGTPFDSQQTIKSRQYRRQAEREQFLEKTLKKFAIIAKVN
jgi:hypothetical protein